MEGPWILNIRPKTEFVSICVVNVKKNVFQNYMLIDWEMVYLVSEVGFIEFGVSMIDFTIGLFDDINYTAQVICCSVVSI